MGLQWRREVTCLLYKLDGYGLHHKLVGRFHSCWPSVSNFANGIVYVIPSDLKQEREVDVW